MTEWTHKLLQQHIQGCFGLATISSGSIGWIIQFIAARAEDSLQLIGGLIALSVFPAILLAVSVFSGNAAAAELRRRSEQSDSEA